MDSNRAPTDARQKTRRQLLRQYVHLQRELVETDPSSAEYQVTIQSFRQMGYVLIASGFEHDLDRLLRIRVLEGGRAHPAPSVERTVPSDLQVIEQRAL